MYEYQIINKDKSCWQTTSPRQTASSTQMKPIKQSGQPGILVGQSQENLSEILTFKNIFIFYSWKEVN